ncbi:hypothetical protein LSH36_726g01036 [Paralvinella palmiformis]|uniref:VWFA domain-containing protein n=1 Tax=Paralvinella palmiformis TaxID=53620 RepID=A0AAD9J1G8_9ANNE|nr:hypothetical protein LSH36_726g01036 [Paralvinella palmiformis]
MKLLVMLALIGLIISDVVISTDVCPPKPSMSVLNTITSNIDCDICSQIKIEDSDFYSKCGTLLSEMILDKLVDDCNRILETGKKAQIQWFWDDLNLACKSKSGLGSAYVKFDPPTCECDPCVELAKASSQFMQLCAPELTECEICEILCKCRQVKNDYEQLWLFYQDLKEQCFDLTAENITIPLCDCDVCWLLFQEKSDFMKNCGYLMSDAMLMKLMETCYDNMDTLDNFMKFLDDLESVCYTKVNGYFKKEWCHCLDCLLLEDPKEPIWEKCVQDLSDEQKKQNREDCLDTMDNEDDFEQFKEDFVDSCSADGVTFPDCDGCTRQDLCVVFVVDSSGSINDTELQMEFDFVKNVIQAFGDNIGPDKTQIGIIIFSNEAHIKLSLCENADQNKVVDTIDEILQNRISGGTFIGKGIDKMVADTSDCCTGENKHKYAIVLTDGVPSFADDTQGAVDDTPDDITLIAIGYAGSNINTLTMIAKNDLGNAHLVDTVEELDSLIDELKSEIG